MVYIILILIVIVIVAAFLVYALGPSFAKRNAKAIEKGVKEGLTDDDEKAE